MAEIKYWNPVRIAWERMVNVLFRPFELEKWMVMGFAAWFAGLNAGGGSGGSGGGSQPGSFGDGLSNGKEAFIEFWAEYGTLILTIGSGVLLLCIVFGVIFAWVAARGKFVFLDNVVQNRAAIVEPWKKYRKQGNSLFLWNLAVGCISLIILLGILAICIPMAWPMFASKTNIPMGIGAIVLGICLLMIYTLCLAYLEVFVYDFVVPLMLKYDIGIRAAWSRFSVILKPRFGTFIVYGLIRSLLSTGVGMALMAAYIMTCCCLLFLAAIPYIGTVLLLPILVFYRFLGLEFMRQFGDDFSVDNVNPTLPRVY